MNNFEPTFNEITDYETEFNEILKKYNTDTKNRKFHIELIEKSTFRLFKCCGIALPADAVMIMTITLKSPDPFPTTSLVLRESGLIEAMPGKNRTDPDCFLVCAAAKFVERYLDLYRTNFRSDTCSGKIRQFVRVLEKLPRESNLETTLGIASTFEN